MSHLGDLLLQLEALQSPNSTNAYITHEQQALETARKIKGQSLRGNLLTKNIINTRTAFTCGRGLTISGWGENESDERRFISAFVQANNLSLAQFRRFGRERCIEGQCLFVLNPHEDGIPRLRFVSWLDTRYEVQSEWQDYGVLRSVEWSSPRSTLVRVPAGQAAFLKFDGRLTENEGVPLLAGCLNQLEQLEELLGLFLAVNKAGARITPHFEFTSEADAAAFQERLKAMNWQMGTALASGGKASVLQIGYGAQLSLDSNLLALVKVISGHSGVPPMYLGFPELLSNRATSDNLADMFVEISEQETDEWGVGFTDVIGRAMAMHNRQTGSRLVTTGGRCVLEVVSDAHFRRVAEVWLAMYEAGALTLETLLQKVPGVDETTEAAAIRAAGGSSVARPVLPLVEDAGGAEGDSLTM